MTAKGAGYPPKMEERRQMIMRHLEAVPCSLCLASVESRPDMTMSRVQCSSCGWSLRHRWQTDRNTMYFIEHLRSNPDVLFRIEENAWAVFNSEKNDFITYWVDK
jgi:hypothetical protein